MFVRWTLAAMVLGLGLACSGASVPEPVLAPVVVAPAPAPAPASARGLVAQHEAGCGFTHRGTDGKIWFLEEIGGGYAIVNVDGTDRTLNPTDLAAPAAPNAKVERAAYSDGGIRIEVARQKKKAWVEITVGEASEKVETVVKTNTCA